jgi:adenylate kinase
MYRTILIIGPPGVGKGTQGKVLGGLPGFLHVSSGECLRALDKGSPAGGEVAAFIARGELVPDEFTLKVWQSAMETFIADGRFDPDKDLLILDGIPRNVAQAEILEQYADVLLVACLVCRDEEAMVARIKGRAQLEDRPDDADEAVIRRRFEVYRRQTEPVLDHYPAELRCEIDALRSPAEVLQAVLNCVIPVQTATQ